MTRSLPGLKEFSVTDGASFGSHIDSTSAWRGGLTRLWNRFGPCPLHILPGQQGAKKEVNRNNGGQACFQIDTAIMVCPEDPWKIHQGC